MYAGPGATDDAIRSRFASNGTVALVVGACVTETGAMKSRQSLAFTRARGQPSPRTASLLKSSPRSERASGGRSFGRRRSGERCR